MNHVYKVPVIPQNLSKQETIVQIAEVLNHLSNVTNDILERINVRIDQNKGNLANISKRVDKVNKKIMKLSGAKKATQVFSSCKYPAADVNYQFISIFSDVNPPELVRHKVKHKKVLNEEASDKLHVYHVKLKQNGNKEPIIGLGDIPDETQYVGDLLLYNSGKNLYKNFVMSDALMVSLHVSEHENYNNNNIGAAPHSISERSSLTRSSTQNYFYTPFLGEVPALDVPLDLPDLPNVADDLRYDTELGPGIAPSVTTTSIIPDLPLFEEPILSSDIEEVEILPSPPVPVTDEDFEPSHVSVPLAKSETPPSIVNEKVPPQLPEMPQVDVRASLMEAIRKAGGAKNLKSTVTVKNDTKSTGGGGDLMADLHAKLSMRRKGISGAKRQEDVMDASSALEKISKMIPSPAKDATENNTEDEDWDD